MSKKDAFPSEAGWKSSQDFEILTVAANRDCVANALGYNATKAYACFVQRDGKTYFMFAHNGTPQEDEDDVNNSCRWHLTEGKGGSLFGQGLKCIAANLVQDITKTELVVAAHCQNGRFSASKGVYAEPRRWNVSVVTDEWHDFIREVCGTKTFSEMKVFYFAAANPRRRGRSSGGDQITCFRGTGANILTFAAPDFYKHIQVRFSQDLLEGSIDEALSSGSSSKNRPIGSMEEFCERYMADEASYTLECKPFRVPILRDEEIEITKARIELKIFLGIKALVKGKSNQWFANHRTSDHGIAGAGMALGSKPNRTSFLFLPFISRSEHDDEIIRTAYERYRTNAVYFGASDEVLRHLGLRYIPNQAVALSKISNELSSEFIERANEMGFSLDELKAKPFVVANIVIEEAPETIRLNPDGTETRIACESAWLEAQLKPCADFTFYKEKVLKDIIAQAAMAAEHNVTEEFRDRMNSLFPVSENQWVPIGVTKTTESNPPSAPFVEVYDLEQDEMVFDKEFHAGENHFLAIRDINTGKWLAADELQLASMTRGVVVDRLNGNIRLVAKARREQIKKNLKKLGSNGNNASAVIFMVDELSKLDANGKKVALDEGESYEHTVSFFPSRQIRVKQGTKTQTVGQVVEVPKAKSRGGGGSSGGTKGHGKGLPYKARDAQILAWWDEENEMLWLNSANDAVIEVFNGVFTLGDKICERCNELYNAMNLVARGAWDGIKLCDEVFVPAHLTNESAEPKYNSDKSDVIIQHLLNRWWAESAESQQIRSEIEQLRARIIPDAEASQVEPVDEGVTV